MASLTVANVVNSSVGRSDNEHSFELLTHSGAGTIEKGTILARQAVTIAITPVADSGNTGTGTCTLATVADGPLVPTVGTYVLECVEAITHGGRFKLLDPQGAQLTDQILMTAADGGTTAIETWGLKFTLTDATDFIVGDFFTIPVLTGSNKMVPFEFDGAGGAQYPKAVMSDDSVATGAGDLAISPYISGTVVAELLIIDSDGDASNITDVVYDQLRDFTIISVPSSNINVADNQT